MPIWLRRFTFKKIEEHYTQQQAEIEKQQNKLQNRQTAKLPKGPAIKPSYTTKASK